jgi:AraC-type DNA-binding domain-containing proteins
VVPVDPQLSARWHVHDYPSILARWNYHPEYEVHLIRRTSGRYIVGDRVGVFAPGQVVLVGPNMPHDWISDASDHVDGRDMVFQFLGEWIRGCQRLLPELGEIDALLARASRGIEFRGRAAERAARELEAIGESLGPRRLQHIFGLFDVLTSAPEDEYELLSNESIPWSPDPHTEAVIGRAIRYIFDNLTGDVRLSTASDMAGMSEAAFSKYFKRASGQTFSAMVRKLRLSQASKLLRQTSSPIARIAREVGYANLSNFNRQFHADFGTTPSRYRALNSTLVPNSRPSEGDRIP